MPPPGRTECWAEKRGVLRGFIEQVAPEGNMCVSPFPTLDEVYRLARKELGETYKLADAD